MINIAKNFISATRQRRDLPVEITQHQQPEAAGSMVAHLRRLPVRSEMDRVGLEAYCTFVVDVDNRKNTNLHLDLPAPQSGDIDHYETFLNRICHFYDE